MIVELSLFELLLGAFFCSCATVLIIFSGKRLLRRKPKAQSPVTAAAPKPRDVLVGTLRNRLQLETCLEHKFYHIPASRLSQNDFPVHYVAIYQSNHKFGPDAGISIYGKVSRCSLVPRCRITEIPRDSREMYYRFDIEEWKTLPAPIAATSYDFVNIRTTLCLLENSSEAPELMLSSIEELSLYRKISSCISGEDRAGRLSFGNAEILFDGGEICVKQKGKMLFSCTYADFKKHPEVILKKIIDKSE